MPGWVGAHDHEMSNRGLGQKAVIVTQWNALKKIRNYFVEKVFLWKADCKTLQSPRLCLFRHMGTHVHIPHQALTKTATAWWSDQWYLFPYFPSFKNYFSFLWQVSWNPKLTHQGFYTFVSGKTNLLSIFHSLLFLKSGKITDQGINALLPSSPSSQRSALNTQTNRRLQSLVSGDP